MEKLLYKLPVFEGPLDLLLYLLSKNKLSIYEIQISEILDQYMEHIELMQSENMDVATEFLEMAARLVHIKTLSLLPRREEAQELTRELTGELIEYSVMKLAAEDFGKRFSSDSFVRSPEDIGADYTYKRKISLLEIYSAYMEASGKGKRLREKPKEEAFSKIMSKGTYISVTQKIVKIMRRLFGGKTLRYESIFKDETSKSGMVATFLALLELIHGKRVSVEGSGRDLTLKMNGGEGRRGKK